MVQKNTEMENIASSVAGRKRAGSLEIDTEPCRAWRSSVLESKNEQRTNVLGKVEEEPGIH